MKRRVAGPWVIYRVVIKGGPGGANAVCEAREWDALEAARPGLHTLVQAGIGSESEAERLARGTSGDPVPRAGTRVAAGRMALAAQPGAGPVKPL
jgi:hypothetical protein